MHADHPWMRVDGDASDKPLDIAVLTRMKQFRAMNKLKKVALKVSIFFPSVTLCITPRKLKSICCKEESMNRIRYIVHL